MRGRHLLEHDWLKVEDVDRLLRRRDQFVEIARRPQHRIGQQARPLGGDGGKIGGGKQRARGKELQKFPTAGGLVDGHDWSSPGLKRAVPRHTLRQWWGRTWPNPSLPAAANKSPRKV